MKKIIALLIALMMVFSLTACMGGGTQSSGASSDQAKPMKDYATDFDGLKKYIEDYNTGGSEADIYYSIIGADNGKRYILNGNAFVEIYDFSTYAGASATPDQATADQAAKDSEKYTNAKNFFAKVKDGKVRLLENSSELTVFVTKSGKYVLLYDETRGYDYAGTVATDAVKKNW